MTSSTMNYGVNEIKAAYSQLKKSRAILTWGEFADGIGYDRTYVSRVINGHEPLTDDFSESVKKFVETIQNVPRITVKNTKNPPSEDDMTYTTPINTSDRGTTIIPISEKDRRIAELEKRLELAEKEKERLYQLLDKVVQKS